MISDLKSGNMLWESHGLFWSENIDYIPLAPVAKSPFFRFFLAAAAARTEAPDGTGGMKDDNDCGSCCKGIPAVVLVEELIFNDDIDFPQFPINNLRLSGMFHVSLHTLLVQSSQVSVLPALWWWAKCCGRRVLLHSRHWTTTYSSSSTFIVAIVKVVFCIFFVYFSFCFVFEFIYPWRLKWW